MSAALNHKPENPDYSGMRVMQSKMVAGVLVTPREMAQMGAPVVPATPPSPDQLRRQQEMAMMAAARRKQQASMSMGMGPTGPGPGMDGTG